MFHLIIINLDRREDRFKSIQQHLREHEFDFIDSVERLSGVESASISDNIQSSSPVQIKFTPAKGCMLSHRNAILLAKSRGWDHVMVVEDDARFVPNANQIIKEAMLNLNQNTKKWSVLFGACVMFQSRGFTKVENGQFPTTTQLLKLRSNQIMTGTHCVLYNSNYYDRIIDFINKEVSSDDPYHLDMLLSLNLPDIYLTVPFLALFTENDTSDVRLGKNTNIDFQNVVESQKRAIEQCDITGQRT